MTFKATATRIELLATSACLSLTLLCAPALAKDIKAGEAVARTTDEVAMKVSQTYCNLVTAGLKPEEALRQAEAEVLPQTTLPPSFSQDVYDRLLQALTSQKNCPAAERSPISPVRAARRTECLNQLDIYTFERTGHLTASHGTCFIQASK